MQIKKLLLPILATVMLICGCQQNNAVSGQDQLVTASENKTTYTAQNIPEYTGSPYVELNNNIPDFQESEYTTEVLNNTAIWMHWGVVRLLMPISVRRSCRLRNGGK